MFKKYYVSLLVFSLSINNAIARVGSGQGHGRTSSGGGFSGGGDGIDIGWLIYLAIKYPHVGVPALIIAAIVFYKSGGAANVIHKQRTIKRYSHTAQKNNFQNGLLELKKTDSAFDENIFGQRVRKTFYSLQSYWSSGEINKIRPFVSDGLYESFSIIYERYNHFNMRNDMENVSIQSCTPIDVQISQHYQTITYKIRASAIDSMRDTTSNKLIGGSKLDESFTEYWSFIRKPGVLTLNKPGLLEGNCPNCAAPLEMMDKASCSSCGAVVHSGEYDWLLVEISQSDWQPEGNKSIPGVTEISAIDSGFNRQSIEDRVSTAFWNVRRAEFFGETKKLSKYAHPELMEKLQKGFQQDVARYYADPAVGTVELLNVQVNDEGLDRAYAKICWSGHTENRSDKRVLPDYNKSRMRNEVYVFERQSGVQTEASKSLSSAHCPGCGAPASDQTHGSCEYCGTPFNDGSRDWILISIMPYVVYQSTVKVAPIQDSEPPAHAGLPYDQSINFDKENLMAVIIEVMYEDGVIDQNEQAVLMEFLQHMNMSVEYINRLMAGINDGSYKVLMPSKTMEKKELLLDVINLCLLDSKISKTERKILNFLGTKFGYSHVDLKMFINKQRSKLYKDGKIYLKTHK